MRKLLLIFGLLICAAGVHAQTPVVCPNGKQTGSNADCRQPAAMDFGKQGTGTASMALPVSVNNTGTSTLTLTATPFALSGTNAADFSFALGTCTANLGIAAGGTCAGTITFTPSGTSAETATLTVNYTNATASTMTITGQGATVTLISSSVCPQALSGNTNYQLTVNVTCAGIAFTISGVTGVDLNLNGHTVTYGNTSSATQVGGLIAIGDNSSATVHNGAMTVGAGTNTWRTTGSAGPPFSSPIGNSTNAIHWLNGAAFFNLTLTSNIQFAPLIYIHGPGSQGNFIAHDNVLNANAIGTCNTVGCRSDSNSIGIRQEGAGSAASAGTHYYNNYQLGGPQGGLNVDAPQAEMDHNLLFPGNATGNNSNPFALQCWAPCNVHDNLVLPQTNSSSNTQGIQLSDVECAGCGGHNATNNSITVIQLPNDSEYGGCTPAGAFGLQFDDAVTGAVATGNTINAISQSCGATGLRATQSDTTTNKSVNGKYSATRQGGAPTCVFNLDTDSGAPGCAIGFSMDSPLGFVSQNDTFTADSAEVFVGPDGASGIHMLSPTFNVGSNPSLFHTFTMKNGNSGAIGSCTNGGACVVQDFHVTDPTFNAGTSATDTNIAAQGGSQRAVSINIEWTQTVTIQGTGGTPASGAVVTYTDSHGNHYTCTTNGSGVCVPKDASTFGNPPTQYRLNNDTGANQVDNGYNPYTITVTGASCSIPTQTGVQVTATRSLTIGCNGILTYPWSGIIDPNNAIDWSTAGSAIAGGRPVRSTVCATIAPYTGTQAPIMEAILKCPANQIVQLQAGTYTWTPALGQPLEWDNIARPNSGTASTPLGFVLRVNGFVQTLTTQGVLGQLGSPTWNNTPGGITNDNNFASWAASTVYTSGKEIFDGTNVQQTQGACTSGSPSAPSWNGTIGGTTTESTGTPCIWKNLGGFGIWTNKGAIGNNGGQVTLKGLGADQTIIKCNPGSTCISMSQGSGGIAPPWATHTNITGGLSKGSITITLQSVSGFSIGGFILISELVDQVNKKISTRGDEGSCSQCAMFYSFASGRSTGQIDKITNMVGSTLTLEQPLFDSYNNPVATDAWQANHTYEFATPMAISSTGHVYTESIANATAPVSGLGTYLCLSGATQPTFPTGSGATVTDGPGSPNPLRLPGCVWTEQGIGNTTLPWATPIAATTVMQGAGLEALQIYDNDVTLRDSNGNGNDQIDLGLCAYCWVDGVELNYTNAFFIADTWGYHNEIVNNYLSNASTHGAGTDTVLYVSNITTGDLVQNNIIERGHGGIIINGGAAGNVIAYNYGVGGFSATAPNAYSFYSYLHSPAPNMNLYEGNQNTGGLKIDMIHGGFSKVSIFREWEQIAAKGCTPITDKTRGAVTCSPTIPIPSCSPLPTCYSTPVGGWYENAAIMGMDISRGARYTNIVGSIIGSQTTSTAYPVSAIPQVWASCDVSTGVSTNCGLGVRPYGSTKLWDIAWGFGNSSDSGDVIGCVGSNATCGNGQVNGPNSFPSWSVHTGNNKYSVGNTVFDGTNIQQLTVAGDSGATTPSWNPTVGLTTTDGGNTWLNTGPYAGAPTISNNISGTTNLPWSTALFHGVYTHANSTINWAAGITHTLPASFYLPAKPSWFKSIPFPASGPDVTGGLADGFGMTNNIPAAVCYASIGGTNGGAGSPYVFNANNCYGATLPVVSTPTFSPVAGTYTAVQNVTISTTTSGATLCYTINGTPPTTNESGGCTGSTLTYSSPIQVSTSETIQTIGTKSGDTDSSLTSAAYTINLQPIATPTFNPPSRAYTTTQSVTISSTTGGATFCYTTDGSTPSTNGSGSCTLTNPNTLTYSGSVSVSISETIRAIGTEFGFLDSSMGSASYIIGQTVAAPVFNPAQGTYAVAQSVTLTTTTPGATICFTVDGSPPTADGAGNCINGIRYTSAIPVSSTTTLKAIGDALGYFDSAVVTAIYTIVAPSNVIAPALPAFMHP